MRRFTMVAMSIGLILWCGCGAHSTPYHNDDEPDADPPIDCLSRELCDDGIDNDCNGQIDEGCFECISRELCDDGLDNNCNGQIDEGCFDGCPPGVSVPTPELCDDGIDNDCDGRADWDDVDCPSVEPECLCIPGSWRWCDSPDYDTPGRQNCDDDGASWGRCREDSIYEGCAAVEAWYSPRFEECLIDAGQCAQDMWDLDHDGDTWESVGACADVACLLPEPEICGDLFDNDFDGHVDETCDACCDDCLCVPGALRWCDDPAYSRLGEQECVASGMEWGRCSEAYLPEVCAAVDGWYSPAFEECLVANGECAQDMWDLDNDGDRWESLGDCTDIVCP
jgi:hypothetical protein